MRSSALSSSALVFSGALRKTLTPSLISERSSFMRDETTLPKSVPAVTVIMRFMTHRPTSSIGNVSRIWGRTPLKISPMEDTEACIALEVTMFGLAEMVDRISVLILSSAVAAASRAPSVEVEMGAAPGSATASATGFCCADGSRDPEQPMGRVIRAASDQLPQCRQSMDCSSDGYAGCVSTMNAKRESGSRPTDRPAYYY